MITHNEITALLWLLVAASSGTAGFGISRAWPSRKRLYAEYDRGYELGAETGYSGGYDDGRFDERNRIEEVMPSGSDRDAPGREGPPVSVRPAGPFPAAGRTTGERYTMEIEGLGSFGPATSRTIYPELAALADPPREPESHAEPTNPVDPHWYANGLHWLADWQADWHADAARFDAWLPGYLDWYRRSLEPSWTEAGRMLETI